MDKEMIETKYLPTSFKKLLDCIQKILRENSDEEDKKDDDKMEREKYQIFAKVLHNIQTTYINQQSRSKVEIGTMIGTMKEDIRLMIGNQIPEGSIDSMITQLQGMSGILE